MTTDIIISSPKAFFEGVKAARTQENQVDPVNAALWALSGFDTALIHLAELREAVRKRPEEDPLRISVDRMCGQYLEAQCRELHAAHDPSMGTRAVNEAISAAIGDMELAQACFFAVGSTSDPLALEVLAYGMYLATFTSHGKAPWNRLAPVLADCFYTKHPLAKRLDV